jgi:hypothetical protein
MREGCKWPGALERRLHTDLPVVEAKFRSEADKGRVAQLSSAMRHDTPGQGARPADPQSLDWRTAGGYGGVRGARGIQTETAPRAKLTLRCTYSRESSAGGCNLHLKLARLLIATLH